MGKILVIGASGNIGGAILPHVDQAPGGRPIRLEQFARNFAYVWL